MFGVFLLTLTCLKIQTKINRRKRRVEDGKKKKKMWKKKNTKLEIFGVFF